jgi:Amt family ammonium transporter
VSGLAFVLLAPFGIAGVALMAAGLCRSRNAAHAMVAALCAFSVAALAWFATGFAWQGHAGGTACVVRIAGRSWNWIGNEPLWMRGVADQGVAANSAMLLGMMGAAMSAVIPLSSGGERWRLGAACVSSALLAGVTFPLFSHWAWGGGWLADIGFVDYGGGATIHGVGGVTGLAMAWVLGPRRGKYSREGVPSAFPGHNGVLVVFGCFLAWIGCIGLGCAGATLFNGSVVLVVVNMTLASAAASLAAAGLTRFRFGKTDASLTANGWTAGLAAARAGCGAMPPAGAVLTGLVAGVLVIYAIELMELRLFVDDPGGAIAVHGVGGLWGVVAFGVIGGRWLPQFVGAATIVGFVLPLGFCLNWALDRTYRQRAPVEGERHGMDLHELGAGAYPDFMSHSEDPWTR